MRELVQSAAYLIQYSLDVASVAWSIMPYGVRGDFTGYGARFRSLDTLTAAGDRTG